MTSPPHNSGRQQAGSWGEGGMAARSMVEGRRWEAYMTITEHLTVFSLSDFLSFTPFTSFSWWCHFHAEPDFQRTLEGVGVAFCSQNSREREGRRWWRTEQGAEVTGNQPCMHDKQLSHGSCNGVWGTSCIDHGSDSLCWCHCFSALGLRVAAVNSRTVLLGLFKLGLSESFQHILMIAIGTSARNMGETRSNR